MGDLTCAAAQTVFLVTPPMGPWLLGALEPVIEAAARPDGFWWGAQVAFSFPSSYILYMKGPPSSLPTGVGAVGQF